MMKIMIEGKEFSQDDLNKWKQKRIKKVLHTLKSELPITDDIDDQLLDLKLGISYEEMIKLLKPKLSIGRIGMKIAVALSFGKRKKAITEIYADGVDAKTVSEKIDDLMLKNLEEYKRVNLKACPDHYVLTPHDDILEVIETTGSAPVPTQFFITFGDETGLKEPRDLSYEYQSVGIAKTKDGTIIGGVRHQFKDTDTGIKARLVVEFPAIVQRKIIREHEKHLATEWSSWLNWIISGQESNELN